MAGAWTALGFLALTAVVAGVPTILENPGPLAAQGAFTRHITAALAINRRRRPVYAEMTQGASLALSDRVIGDEKLALIVARYFDWRAAPFNRQGIGIVRDDFVPMIPLHAAGALPVYRGLIPAADLTRLGHEVAAFERRARTEIAADDFAQLAASAYALSTLLEREERETRSNLAMTRHLVNEVGYAAMHAIRYHLQSGGRTDDLDRQFLGALMLPLAQGLGADRDAQAFAAMGAGILVNDLPDIPFCAQWTTKPAY